MREARKNDSPADAIAPAGLAQLNLSADALRALRRGGYLRSTLRGRGTRIFELVYRVHGRQRRRYLGVDENLADEVRDGLDQWQSRHKDHVKLRLAAREAGQRMRDAKQALAERLIVAGYHFHGLTIRRVRTAGSSNSNNNAALD